MIYEKGTPGWLEAQLLGAALLEQPAFGQINHLIEVEYFTDPLHQKIWGCMLELHANGNPIDILTVPMAMMSRHGNHYHYIAEISSHIASSANIVYYAQLMADDLIQREVIQRSKALVDDPKLLESDEWYRQDIEFRQRWLDIGMRFKGSPDLNTQLVETIKQIDKAARLQGMAGVPTSNKDLDGFTGGFQEGEMIVLAARPSVGKTAKLLDIIYTAVTQGKSAYMASLEMSRHEILKRLLARITGINSQHMKTNEANHIDMDALQEASASLGELRLTIDDRPRMSIDMIIAAARHHEKMNGSIDIIGIDYLQIINTPFRKGRSRVDDITEISGKIKAMAMDFKCPVVVLSQLSRGVESRTDKRPALSDLRDSGAIEQDADIVLTLYRPSLYHRDSFDDEDYKNMHEPGRYQELIELRVLKNRNGAIGFSTEFFDVTTGRFEYISTP